MAGSCGEMQIRGVVVEPVDVDDFSSPSTSRPRRSVPRKDYLAMLDANKSVKPSSSSPRKQGPRTLSSEQEDEQLRMWKIVVKHDLISQVNKQICGETQSVASNDENSRKHCFNHGDDSLFKLKSEEVTSIFDHFKWLRRSRDDAPAIKCEPVDDGTRCKGSQQIPLVKIESQPVDDGTPCKTSQQIPLVKIEPQPVDEETPCKASQQIPLVKTEPRQPDKSAEHAPARHEDVAKTKRASASGKARSCHDGPSTEQCVLKIKKGRNTPEQRKRKFQCTYCSKLFLTARNLNAHVMTHSGIKPLVVRHERHVHNVECGKCVPTLKSKELTHGVESTLRCDVCGKVCMVLPSLYRYVVRSKTGKTFRCDTCSKANS